MSRVLGPQALQKGDRGARHLTPTPTPHTQTPPASASLLLSQVILSESSMGAEVPFFETWMQTCMPEEGKILNPDHPCFRPDSTKVESLVALLNNSSEMKLVSVGEPQCPGWGALPTLAS